MNKNTIIGFVLIGAVLFGFTWFQSKQYEKQVAYQAQLDSLAAVQAREQYIQDSIAGFLWQRIQQLPAALTVQILRRIMQRRLLPFIRIRC